MPTALHIVAGLAPQDGGPTYSVPRLCASLRGLGCATRIFTVQGEGTLRQDDVEAFPQSASRVPVLRAMRCSAKLAGAAVRSARQHDVVHAHGLWLMPNVHSGRAAASAGKPLIVSPRGMLAPEAMRFSHCKKRLFWLAMQKEAYARAAAWHATCEEEASDIRRFGVRAPIAVIPNGIDVTAHVALHAEVKARRKLVFLSRLHPKKGLTNLISAWSQLAEERPDWDLLIAGQDEGGHRTELETRIAADAIPRVSFTGPLYGEDKARLLKEADLFVLPTRSENFGIAVAEALTAGVPAVVTTGAPWAGLVEHGCGWWIEQGVDPLLLALREATVLAPADRRAMGERGRAWMARDFGWDCVARQMLDVYRWLGEGGSPPDFVQID